MSFVNLLHDDVWTGPDIENRVKNMIRSRYSENDEMKAARLSRKKAPTESESRFVSSVDYWIEYCLEEGRQSLDDMQKLHKVFEVEKAKQRLVIKKVALKYDENGNVINQDLVDADVTERSSAQAVIDSATSDVLSIVSSRNREFIAPRDPEDYEAEVSVLEETVQPSVVEEEILRPEWLPPLPIIEELSVIEARLQQEREAQTTETPVEETVEETKE